MSREEKGVREWPGKVESRGRQEAKIHPVPRHWAGDSQHSNFFNRGVRLRANQAHDNRVPFDWATFSLQLHGNSEASRAVTTHAACVKRACDEIVIGW